MNKGDKAFEVKQTKHCGKKKKNRECALSVCGKGRGTTKNQPLHSHNTLFKHQLLTVLSINYIETQYKSIKSKSQMEIKSITNGSYPSEGFLSFCFSVPQTVFLCVTTRNTSANGQTTKTLKKEIEQSSFENKAKGGM